MPTRLSRRFRNTCCAGHGDGRCVIDQRPAQSRHRAYQFIGFTLYDALVAWEMKVADRHGKLVPGLATAWETDLADRLLAPAFRKSCTQPRQVPGR